MPGLTEVDGYDGPERRTSVNVGELDRRMDRFDNRLEKLDTTIKDGLNDLKDTIVATTSTYVRLDLYLSERDGMIGDLKATRVIAMWALGLVATTSFSGILGVLMFLVSR